MIIMLEDAPALGISLVVHPVLRVYFPLFLAAVTYEVLADAHAIAFPLSSISLSH